MADYPVNPSRRPTNRGMRKVIGKYPSAKAGRMVISEGSLERDYLKTLEFDERVVKILEQPVQIRYRYWEHGEILLESDAAPSQEERVVPPGGKRTHYTPDFFVELRAGVPLLVEVKSSHLLTDPKVQRKIAAGRLYARQQGWEFRVVTEAIREGVYLQNIRVLQRYGNMRLPPETAATIQEALLHNPGGLTVQELAQRLNAGADHRVNEALVYAAVFHRMITIDLYSVRISAQSIVTLRGKADRVG